MRTANLSALVFAALLLSYDGHHASIDRRQVVQSIVERVTSNLEAQAKGFLDKCTVIEETADIAELRGYYEGLRRAYKAMEPLIEHIDPSMVTQQLNGAPLPKLDVKSQYVDVLEPHGLQVIDELLGLADDTLLAKRNDLIAEADLFRTNVLAAGSLLRGMRWTDRLVLESCRTGILRLTTMGLSSFDRPATDPDLKENVALVETIVNLLLAFGDLSRQFDSNATLLSILEHLQSVKGLLATPDQQLDKVELIRRHLDPAYGLIARLQLSMGIELSTEIGPAQPVVNPTAASMFSDTTLVAAAASGLYYKSITPEVVELGRTLFFDPILSSNEQRACASCHQPESSFTDGQDRAPAFDHQGKIKRNTPSLVNAVFSRRFFYDLRAQRISDVVSHVITDEQEFHSSLVDVVGRLRQSPEYVTMFEKALKASGPQAIDATNLSLALGAYMTTLVSMNSRFDRYLRGERVSITDSERRGFNIFMGKGACASCHFPPTYAGYVPPTFLESESEIIGVPARVDTINATPDSDIGRAGGLLRENAAIYRGSFKTTSVRNVARTAPYFHNGSYENLQQVVDFYVRGGGAGIGLDVPYQTLPFDRLELSQQDRTDLISFMHALTDTSLRVQPPERLPRFGDAERDARPIGGSY
ncbi:MAG: hypothetical protein FGM32_00335 [Candidatus Kapabacteria bacterium]|nr:hypothetical protein [Candidatus Kapabacteria bacterium]